jgi:hypothetical protein
MIFIYFLSFIGFILFHTILLHQIEIGIGVTLIFIIKFGFNFGKIITEIENSLLLFGLAAQYEIQIRIEIYMIARMLKENRYGKSKEHKAREKEK